MKGALLIGGAGFLGQNLEEAFQQQGCRTLVADPAVREPTERRLCVSLAQSDGIARLLADDSLDVVVHLASGLLPASDEAAYLREQDALIRPSLELIGTCARLRKRFVLFSSGGTVYGDGGAAPIAESRALVPKSRYGHSKVLMEQAVVQAHARDGLEYLILRPSNPYGRHQRLDSSQGLIAVALGKALSGNPVQIWGDGSAVRDYVDVRDLATAVVDLTLAPVVNRTLNMSSGVGHSIDEVIVKVEHLTGRPIARQYLPARSTDVRSVILDSTELSRLVSWSPRGLDQGIEEFYEEIRSTCHA